MTTNRTLCHLWAALALMLMLASSAMAQGGRGGYQILQATYGTRDRSVDVTQRLRDLARENQRFRIENDVFGVDPDEGRVKTLRIAARGPGGAQRTFEYREGDVVDGGQFTGWRGGDWGHGGGDRGDRAGDRGDRGGDHADGGQYRILQARYGTARRNVDVTQRLKELARADQPFRLENDVFGVDPDEGRVKTLRIYARGPGGAARTFEFREGNVVDGGQFSGWRRGDWGQGGWNGGWGGGQRR